MLNGELGGLLRSSRNWVSEGPRACRFPCVGVEASSASTVASVLTEGGARMDVPWLLKPSRLSEDETVRSVEESRPTRGRCVISFGDPDTTKTTGEAVRPFLSEEMSRAEEVLTLSTDALRVEAAFLA
jgi:hypothetical protein